MKFFNTAGPVNQDAHYKLDPLSRWDLDEILMLIHQMKYFILHAPRQTGKTSSLLAMQDYLNNSGEYCCIYVNFEAGQTTRNDVDKGLRGLTQELHDRAVYSLKRELNLDLKTILEDEPMKLLMSYLSALCQELDKPLVLLIDEIDALVGDTLVSVLRQLRSGYDKRPKHFPQSVVLCGVRDIKDYRIHRSDGEIITGGSCFNIKAESLVLGNFTEEEVVQLYGEHTKETGQQFEDACFPLIMRLTGGQPWLVNALAYEVTFKMKENRNPSVVITADMIKEAKERLILSRATHLDQLADKLKEERVRRVIEPILIGEELQALDDDIEYCKDLGLIKKSSRGLIISNEIYREVLPRELCNVTQEKFLYRFTPEWVNDDKTLNSDVLFELFQKFWRENSDLWKDDIPGYKEAAPHLIFQAFLQRVANGQGMITREFAYGTRRADLVLEWKHPNGEQRVVIELKMLKERDVLAKLKEDALIQTARYADYCDATEAHIVIFDRCGKTNWREKVYKEICEKDGYKITIWGM